MSKSESVTAKNREMRFLLFIIGFLLIAGGLFAITSPRAVVFFTSGPDPQTDVERSIVDHISKERGKCVGYCALLLGVGACAVGFISKDLKIPEPHDNSA